MLDSEGRKLFGVGILEGKPRRGKTKRRKPHTRLRKGKNSEKHEKGEKQHGRHRSGKKHRMRRLKKKMESKKAKALECVFPRIILLKAAVDGRLESRDTRIEFPTQR
jgi:hypothetical protein